MHRNWWNKVCQRNKQLTTNELDIGRLSTTYQNTERACACTEISNIITIIMRLLLDQDHQYQMSFTSFHCLRCWAVNYA